MEWIGEVSGPLAELRQNTHQHPIGTAISVGVLPPMTAAS
jgi:hypothetical protein